MEEMDIRGDEFNLEKYIVLIGNPGVGKSTLLNCLMGERKFESGISIGKGLTQHYQLHKHKDGITYGDTPGLSDIKMRENAGKEITKLLKLNGIYQLIFVVTVEAGRVRPEDITTINLVLDSINRIVPFGVIINKCSKVFISDLISNNRNARENIVSAINSGNHKTESIYYFENVKEMDDQPNVVMNLPNDLINFILTVPYVCIYEEDVKEIPINQFDGFKNKIEKLINECIDDGKQRQKVLVESVDILNKERENMIIRQKEQLETYKNKTLQMEQEKLLIEEKFFKEMQEQQRKFQEKIQKADEKQRIKLENERKKFVEQLERQKQENEKDLQHLMQINNQKIEYIQRCAELNSNKGSTLETLLGFAGPIITTFITAGTCLIF